MLRKYAKVQVAEVRRSDERVQTASLDKLASLDKVSFDEDQYRLDDGFLYARIWAISSRVNKNKDGWPSVELAGSQDIFDRHVSSASGGSFVVEASQGGKAGFATFMGRPIFVDHTNSDHKRTRGAIVDSRLHVDLSKTAAELDPYYATAPDNHKPPTKVELLLEIDAQKFPKFAAAVIKGAKDPESGIDGWSMGCDVDHTVCSICSNVAKHPKDYCKHVQMKGSKFPVKNARTGAFEERVAYEDCYGINFFEISGVFDPADVTALSQDVRSHWRSSRVAEAPLPQSDMIKAPAEVDTLRTEDVCPVCGEKMDDGPICAKCGYEQPPEQFQNPDLQKARQGIGNDAELAGQQQLPPTPEPIKAPAAHEGTNRMSWTAISAKPKSNEPDEEVVRDEDAPTTSRQAAEPGDPSFKAQKRVDVNGVGGVIDASNEEASKAQKQVDVTGKGGIIEDVSPDSTESVSKEERITGTPTDTWHGTKGQQTPVTDAVFPTEDRVSAKQGVDPVDPAFKAKERVNVDEAIEVSKGEMGKTQTWHGTDGNGVTRQQAPVTNEVFPTSDRVSKHFVACLRLAEVEVDLGLLPEERKLDRVEELQPEPENVVAARLDAYASVKKAGLSRQASTATRTQRLPSLSRQASITPPDPAPRIDQDVADAGLFSANLPPAEVG